MTPTIDATHHASGSVSITAAQVDNGSSDNCTITSRVVSPSSFNCTKDRHSVVKRTTTDISLEPKRVLHRRRQRQREHLRRPGGQRLERQLHYHQPGGQPVQLQLHQ